MISSEHNIRVDARQCCSKSSSTALHTFTFRHWFAMPQKSIEIYAADNSGFGPNPHPTSDVKSSNRADRLSHLVFKESLSGPDAASICRRFAIRLSQRLVNANVKDYWTYMPDLVVFFQLHMTPANTESLWGTHLTENSNFCSDFWKFNRQLQHFSWHLPRWMIPKAYSHRDRLLEAMKQWQLHLTDRETAPWDEDIYDAQRWGSRLMRKWQKLFLQMDNTNEEALASVNLTFSWAVNSNVVPSTFWAVLEIFRRPELLFQVRKRLPDIRTTAGFLQHFSDSEKRASICTEPLLQSIFAETLRLRVHVYMARLFIHDSVDLDGWRIPQGKLCLVSSHPAHMHGSEWNTAGGKHPLEEFWPYRFLVPSENVSNQSESVPAQASNEELQANMSFSLNGLDGSWIPFGGGPRGCPGRFLAKHHMITTMASMVLLFEIDILAKERAFRMDETKYGAGTLHPVGEIPFRIRSRFAGGSM
ncbi:cytochrome P450 [Mollisia scopiformis]|uniref:Cytochrome P450 n=1 Tax=Mollisia scopiformis TaxID=149040 RepID=A0A132BC28_MOLSC|nr:cytochrome P450 [Mollisia scopiformis]KUJ09823.1 cytochrome P450 [Mollisia scopiformis]